jgi:DNA-binding MarR family transcriptional regulator
VRLTNRGRTCLEAATRRVRVVEHAAFADLSREDERTVRAWLASLAALTTGPHKAEAEQKEKS